MDKKEDCMFDSVNFDKKNAQHDNYIELEPGLVDIRYFRLLMTISPIRNQKVRCALEAVLVHGISRKEACSINNVNKGYFSIKYNHLQFINQTVFRMITFIKDDF